MICGETRKLRHKETADESFMATAKSIVVTKPDGTAVAPTPDVVEVAVTGDPRSMEYRAALTADQAGIYQALWSLTINGEVLKRPETYFAAWTDVYGLIRARLAKTPTALGDDLIDPALAATARSLASLYAIVSEYRLLSMADQEPFDTALALTAAYRLRPYVTGGGAAGTPAGTVTSMTQGGVTIRYADPRPTQQLMAVQVDALLDEAWESLRRVSAIQAVYADLKRHYHLFVPAGPTTKRQKWDALGSPYNPLYSLVQSEEFTVNADVYLPAGVDAEDENE